MPYVVPRLQDHRTTLHVTNHIHCSNYLSYSFVGISNHNSNTDKLEFQLGFRDHGKRSLQETREIWPSYFLGVILGQGWSWIRLSFSLNQDKLKPGEVVYIYGTAPDGGLGMVFIIINHFNPHFNESCVVRNSFIGGGWGDENRYGGLPFAHNKCYTSAIIF